MPRLPKKTNNSAASEYHRKCHMAYVPRTVKVVKHPISRNMRYEQYIELNDHCKQETSNENKCYIQEELPGKKKEVHEVKQEIIRVEEEDIPDEPIMECYIDKSYYSSPVIVNTEINKVSTPIKKINFNLPKDKSFHDLEEDEKPPPDERMDWKDYHELSVIHKFMDDLEADFPSLCTTGIIGTSVEGRNLKILKISNSNASNACVWVDAGIHAREWIAPAVNTYLADHISRNFDKLPESIRNKDWYFLPVLNPDGYEYTHTTDRMWRKNRAWYGGQCVGVDLNRNFSIGWGGKGSSDQPNNAFFRGPHPFSEPESSAIRDVLLKSGVNFKVYITLHSYGQIIIFPYACSSELAPDYVRLLEGATVMSKAIYDTNGNTYKVGISRDVMYGAAGTSNDFAHGAASIPYCYLIELRSKKHKFKLPKEEIEETCNEILSCVKALMEFVDTYKYTKRSESDQDINVVKKNVSFLEKKKSTAERSDSYLSVVNSYIGKRDSYDKRSYSYINRSDSGIEKGNSFVRWINLPSKEEDPKENTGDAKKTDTYTNENNFFKKNDVSVQQTYDKNKGNDSFEKINDSFVKETDNLKIASDSFLQPNDYVDASDSFMKNTDSFMKKADYYMKKTDSYMKKTNSYMKKTESYMRKTDSYMKNTDSRSKKTNSFEENDSLEAEIAGTIKVAPPVPNTQVWEVKFIREGQRHFVKTLDTIGAINIWKEERSTMDVMVEGPRAAQVAGMLHERDIPYSVAIPDITSLLERERGTALSRALRRSSAGLRKTMDWKNYHRLDTIYAFMDNLAAEYPYLCTVSVIGKSVEGRDLKMLKISNGNESNTGVWLDGSIHPREWISPAVVTYIADRIVRTFNNQPESVTNKDWYILPVMNPDGYEYTHTHDRMWRKNRARYGECVGVDLNRNFSYGFGEKGEEGSSDDPGNVFYRGPKAFSEPETAAVRRVIVESPTTFKVFLSFHSYGEVIIFPWGYTSEPCPDYVELLEGGTAMAKAIYNTNGNTYKVGSTKDLMYYAAGTSIDWSYAVTNITYSYMVELRGKTHRFLLPKEEIISTATEVLNGVLRLLQFVDRRCTGTQSCACPK